MPAVPMSMSEIADDMEARIRAGDYPPGSQMPTYASLARAYGVGMTTIQSVISLLKDRGLLVGHRGRGTYVVDELPD